MSDSLTITAANSQYMLTVDRLYTTPFRLEGFSADDVFGTEDMEFVETVMGVDGRLSAGFVCVAIPQTITIMPDSPSSTYFDNWSGAQRNAREVYRCDGTCILPGIAMAYRMTRGFMTRYKPIPDVRRVLQARQFRIVWEKIEGAPYSIPA
jgi:hypothetical protein